LTTSFEKSREELAQAADEAEALAKQLSEGVRLLEESARRARMLSNARLH